MEQLTVDTMYLGEMDEIISINLVQHAQRCLEHLLADADQALYRAKNGGRNLVKTC